MSRYRIARAMGRFDEVVEEDEALLQLFGAQLLSVDAGVRVVRLEEIKGGKIHPWNVIEVNGRAWHWLRPLLAELRRHRLRDDACAQANKTTKLLAEEITPTAAHPTS